MSIIDEQRWHGRLHSGGWRTGGAGDHPVIEPATGDTLATVARGDADDITRAAHQAAAAQQEWAVTGYDTRSAILRRAAALLEEHAPELHPWMIRETGSVPAKVANETGWASEELAEAAGLARQPEGQLLRTNAPRMSLARRRPVGVVGVISPFNFPLILSTRAVAPALALGNAVVLKPDPRTPLTGGLLLAQVLEEAGLPEGLLHVIPGDAEVGEALVADPQVPLISFTGSVEGGRAVGQAAARHLKRTHLELGGNSALVIFDDADLERAVSAGAFASFLHQGQICMTAGRHLVHQAVAGDYLEALRATAEALPVGDPAVEEVALGPVIDAGQRDRIHGLVSDSVTDGARLVAGGSYDGLFYRPTVLAEVTERTPAYAQEVFGPVAPVRTFADVDEAARLAADSPHGLSLGILTRDVMRGVALADRIPSGKVHINDQTVADEAVAPFGGVGDSGDGSRLGGTANLEAFTELQWLTLQGEIPQYPF